MVDFERTMRLTRAFDTNGNERATDHLCRTAAMLLDAIAASLSLVDGPTFASSTFALALEELQFTLGEGPGPDATSGEVVEVPDLLTSERWPTFAPAARDHGVRAIFAYPLGSGLGAMTLYRDVVGPLTPAEGDDALVVAQVITIRLGQLGPATVLDGARHDEYRAEVYQATGMLARQLGITPDEALARIRAHAFAEDTRLLFVARQVVDRSLRLEADKGGTA
jgi:hypothetical protein